MSQPADTGPTRLVTIRPSIGAIRPFRPALQPPTTEMLARALDFAGEAAARYAVHRAGEPATMVFDHAALELRLSLSPAPSTARAPAAPARAPAPAGSIPEAMAPPPADAGAPPAGRGFPELDLRDAGDAGPAPTPPTGRVPLATEPAGPAPPAAGALDDDRWPHDASAADRSPPGRPPVSGFEPVPRRSRRAELQAVEWITREIRELHLGSADREPRAATAVSRAPAGRVAPSAIDLRSLTSDVVRELERRSTALRERKGRA